MRRVAAQPSIVLALCLAVAVVATLGVRGAASASGTCTPDAAWPGARSDLASQVLALVNSHRRAVGLAPLTVAAPLQASAEWKARHMARYGYMAHDDPAPPVARSWYDRITACGYVGGAAENIARGYPTAATVVAGWLSDPPHRANIEGAWTTTGIGAAVGPSGVYWAEDFGTGGSPPPTTTQATSVCVVPDVLRLTTSTARSRIRRAGCRVRVRLVRTRGVPAGRVAWQSPRAGVRMPRGSVVTIGSRAVRR